MAPETPINCVTHFPLIHSLEATLSPLNLSDEEREATEQLFKTGLRRGNWSCLRRRALVAVLPVIQRRARGFFIDKGVTFRDAEDLSGDVVTKILRFLDKDCPHGNSGAWVIQIRFNALVEYCRHNKCAQTVEIDGNRRVELANHPDPGPSQIDLNDAIERLQSVFREILQELQAGHSWREIASHRGLTQKKARELALEAIQRLKELGGSISPSINRRIC